MRITIILLIMMNIYESATYRIEFGETKDVQPWTIVNDGVMGGLSQSAAKITNNSLLFKGTISLKNNGGFAMVRSPKGKFDLSQHSSIRIKFRSKGRDFSIRLATSEFYFKPNYKHKFRSVTENWETIDLKLSDFKKYTLGQITGNHMPKGKMDNIIRVGIILNDKKEGPFEIEVDYIEFR